jgi:hypothetical protein
MNRTQDIKEILKSLELAGFSYRGLPQADGKVMWYCVDCPFYSRSGDGLHVYVVHRGTAVFFTDSSDTLYNVTENFFRRGDLRLATIRPAVEALGVTLSDTGEISATARSDNILGVFWRIVAALLVVSDWADKYDSSDDAGERHRI